MISGLSVGAGNVTRTHDLLITNQLLYRLSYTSVNFDIIAHSFHFVNEKSRRKTFILPT